MEINPICYYIGIITKYFKQKIILSLDPNKCFEILNPFQQRPLQNTDTLETFCSAVVRPADVRRTVVAPSRRGNTAVLKKSGKNVATALGIDYRSHRIMSISPAVKKIRWPRQTHFYPRSPFTLIALRHITFTASVSP
jgi:hypothetical protein